MKSLLNEYIVESTGQFICPGSLWPHIGQSKSFRTSPGHIAEHVQTIHIHQSGSINKYLHDHLKQANCKSDGLT